MVKLYDRKYFFEEAISGKFLFPFVYNAYCELSAKAHTCIKTSEFNNTFDKEYEAGDVVFGSIELCKKAFEKNSIEVPYYLGYPKELKNFYGRDITVMNYSEAMNEPLPVFIKPKDEVKGFTGTLFEKEKWRQITLNGHEDSMFYVQGKLKIESEWRIFVHKGEIYACQYYSGNPIKFPHDNVINRIKETYESLNNTPIAYTLDVGIDRNDITNLIEINDMWSTGIYGAPEYEYTMAYIDRWLEIINK